LEEEIAELFDELFEVNGVGGFAGVFGDLVNFMGGKPRLQLTVYSSPSKQKKQQLETQLILPSTGAILSCPYERLGCGSRWRVTFSI